MKVYATELCQQPADSVDEVVAQRLATCDGHLPERIAVHHYMKVTSDDDGEHVMATEQSTLVHVKSWLQQHNPNLLETATAQAWAFGGTW